MMIFLKKWVSQIIVAVIVATIIEMILPNGNNKKYIKMIIGLYVLIIIIQPIVLNSTGNNIKIPDLNYKKYFDEDVIESTVEDFDDTNSKLIKQTYIKNINSDIIQKLKQKGYEVISCNVEIDDCDNYGKIKSIDIAITDSKKQKEDNEYNENKIGIENIKIDNNPENIKKYEDSNVSDEEKQKIIEYISEEYSVSKIDIIIN